jgi:hypothetical protein
MNGRLIEAEQTFEGRTYVLTYERVMQPYGVAEFRRFQKVDEDGNLVDADTADIRDSYAFGVMWRDVPQPRSDD